MPPLNGSGFMSSYNSSLGEVETAILETGIHLYELKPTTLQYYSDSIMGLWAVQVNYRPTATNKVIPVVDWYNQKGAYVKVNVFGKGGKRFAYVPDDPLWHNRLGMIGIVLGKTPAYEILRYHTQEGFSGGARAIKELVMLRDLTQEWIVWNRDKKIEVYRSFDGAECDQFIADEKRKDQNNEVQVVGGAEVLLKKAQMYKASDHLELRCVKVKSIQKIIDRAGIGWMTDDEWVKEVLPDIQKQIKERFGQEDLKARRAEALRYLPEIQEQLNTANKQLEELQPLVKLMKDPKFANMIMQFAPDVAEAKIPEKVAIVSVVPKFDVNEANMTNGTDNPKYTPTEAKQEIKVPEAHTELGEKKLEELSITALRSIARSTHGIKNVERKSQEALLAEIREKQGIPDGEVSQEADEIDVNE